MLNCVPQRNTKYVHRQGVALNEACEGVALAVGAACSHFVIGHGHTSND
jgi:hypothetical protein